MLQYAAEKSIESFLPVVLELLASLLETDRRALVTKQPGVNGHAIPWTRLSMQSSHMAGGLESMPG